MNLEGKNILVTGGSKGIGKAIVLYLASQGANVGFSYLSTQPNLTEMQDILKKNNVNIKLKAYQADVAKLEQAETLVENFLKDFGQINALVNNAGITKDNLLLRMNEEQWDQVLDTNLKACFFLVKAVIKPMIKQKNGSIVHISSIVGVKGNAGQANYAASKAGMIGFSQSVALELGSRNIRSNVVAPGFIETEMTEILDEKIKEEWLKSIPLKRIGKAEDVAKAVSFFCSDLSDYITGQTLLVTGGL